jgi:hypothetical protein
MANLIDFRLPDGRIVRINADVAGFHNWISYTLANGKVVLAERVR